MGDIGPTQQRYEVLPATEPLVEPVVEPLIEPAADAPVEREPEPRVRTSR